jgi:tRNA (mo5U34)-methyltransferase
MPLDRILAEVPDFKNKMAAVKASIENVPWYGYDSFANFYLINEHFRGPGRRMFDGIRSGLRIADVGAADGDTSFFFESLGARVTIIDYPTTNANDCRAILGLRSALHSDARFIPVDLDWTPRLDGEYDLTVLLGILYHLRNPMLVLNTLAFASEHLLLSTKVFTNYKGRDIGDANLACLLESREINNDPTNYWLFTPKSLRVCLKRCGWTVLDEFIVDDTAHGDHRMFCYCKRVPNWRDTRAHHDF